MQRNFSTRKFWLTALGILILVAGLSGAYLLRAQAHAGDGHYRIVGGQAYLDQSEDSKQDAGEMQRYGGNAAIIIAAYKRKFHNLLQGDSLAYFLAIIALIVAAGCFRSAWNSEDLD